MKQQLHFEISADIDDVKYNLNPITNSSDEILGHDCELEVVTNCGTIYLNIETPQDLADLTDILQDIYAIWRNKDSKIATERWGRK